jgi:hypothetical protein
VKHAYVQHQFAKITAATISIQEMTFAKVSEACLCTASVRQDHRRHHLHPRDDLRQGVKHAYVQHQFAKITAAATISIQEMTFAKVRVAGIYL